MKKSQKERYKFEGHSWLSNKNFGKQVCYGCGLIALNTEATDWCIRKGCNYKDDPAYESTMVRLTEGKSFQRRK
jgi:hypothetical protein